MSKKTITYQDAINEVEEILEKIEEGQLDVDELTRNVERVSGLLKICKDKLHIAENEVNKILDKE